MTAESFCAVEEHILAEARNAACQWPRGHIVNVRIDEVPDEFTDADYREIVLESLAVIESVCGVKLALNTGGHPDIVLLHRRIDSVYGVLADAQLPCGVRVGRTTLRVRFDTSEDWVNAVNFPNGKMDMGRVQRHELLHALGLGHTQTLNQLMNPSVSAIRVPRPEWDVPQLVIRYGKVQATPDDGDTPLVQCLKQIGAGASAEDINQIWEFAKRKLCK